MIKLKTKILSLLETKGWSLEELDFRLRRPEGFISDFICNNSVKKLPRDIIMLLGTLLDSPYEELLKMNIKPEEDSTYIYGKVSDLHDSTEYGHTYWERCDGKIAFVTSEEDDSIMKAIIRKDREGLHYPPYFSKKETFEAGPTYHYRTRNGVDIYLSKTVAENEKHTGYDFTNAIYLTDKRGYLLAYTELSDSPDLRGQSILKDFAVCDLDDLYEELLYVHKDSLYEVF